MSSLDLGDKFDTSNVTEMQSMFFGCGYESLTSLDLGDKFDTSSVTNMNRIFRDLGYKALTSLDLGGKFNTSCVTDFEHMFNRCGKTKMTTLIYGGTVSNFKTNCATLISNASTAYFNTKGMPKCTGVTCSNGTYSLPT